jgi:hypothetical protein
MSGDQSTLPTSAMGGITFGQNAFPNASQAAFGGMGGTGYGIGYGGSSSGAGITFVPATSQAAAAAPSGEGSMDVTSLIMIAGIILAVILVVAMLSGKGHDSGGYSRRRR